jgi:hypothetical protein
MPGSQPQLAGPVPNRGRGPDGTECQVAPRTISRFPGRGTAATWWCWGRSADSGGPTLSAGLHQQVVGGTIQPMSDHIITRDQLRQLVEVSEPTPIPVSARRWTEAEWAIISRERDMYDMTSRWIVFVEDARLFLHHTRIGRSIFEARFAHGDDGWAIAELLVCGNRDIYRRQADVDDLRRAEYLIDSIALGASGRWPMSWALEELMEDMTTGHAPPSRAVQEFIESLAASTSPAPTPVSDKMFAGRRAASQTGTGGAVSQVAPGGAPTPGHSPTGGTVPGACLFCRYKIPAIKTPIGTVDVPIGLCQNCNSLSCGSHGERTATAKFMCILCDANLKLSSAGWKGFKSSGGLAKLPGGSRASVGSATGGRPGDRGGPSARADSQVPDLAFALASLFAESNGSPSPLVVQNLEEWAAARPDYKQLTDALADSVDGAVRAIHSLPGFELSAHQSEATDWPGGTAQDVPGGYDIDDVRSLWTDIGADGRRLLASAVLLTVLFDLPVARMPPPVAAVATVLSGPLRRTFSDEIPGIRERVVDQGYYRRQA